MRSYYHKSSRRRANQRQTYIRKAYGVPIEQLDQILADQRSRCAICKRHWSKCKPIKRTHYDASYLQHLGVDHAHDTGAIRGLLCNACNLAIGLLGEDIATFRRAADYLSRAREARLLGSPNAQA
jgi:hypothetical protein